MRHHHLLTLRLTQKPKIGVPQSCVTSKRDGLDNTSQGLYIVALHACSSPAYIFFIFLFIAPA